MGTALEPGKADNMTNGMKFLKQKDSSEGVYFRIALSEVIAEIEKEIDYEELPCINLGYLGETLQKCHWGEWEIEQIIEAVKNAPNHGTEYKTI